MTSELQHLQAENAMLKQRIAALEQQRETKEKYPLFEAGPVVFFRWIASENWPVEYVSPNVSIFGYTAEDFLSGQISYPSIVYPEDLPRVAEEVQTYSQEGRTSFEQDYRIFSAEGQVRKIYDYTSIIRDEEGNITHYEGYIFDITRQRQTETALRQSKTLLQRVIDNSPSIIYAKDTHWRLTLVNKQFANLLNMEPEQIVGNNDHELFPPDEVEAMRATERSVVESGQPISQEETYVQDDGPHTFLSIKFPIYDSTSNIYGVGSITSDITERKQLEKELQEREQRLRLILEGSSDGAWDWNIATGEAFLSDRWMEILGYAPDELPNNVETWMRVMHPEDQPVVNQTLQDYLAGEREEYSVEHRLQHKSGAWVWALSRGKVVARDDDGRPIRITGTTTDISERKQADAALQESEERNRLLFQNMAEGVVFHALVYDEQGTPVDYRILEVNPSFERMLQMPRSAIIGKLATEAYGVESAPFLDIYTRVSESGIAEQFQTPFGSKMFDIRVTSPRRGEFVTMFFDITEQKRQEEAQIALQEQIIEAQRAALRELSSPLIPLADNVVIMPLIGSIDSRRAQQVMEDLLEGVAHHHAETAILDITGVSVVDTQVANALIQAAQAVKLLGSQVILTGIGPTMAQTLVGLGADLSSIVTRGNLQSGIAYALNQNQHPS